MSNARSVALEQDLPMPPEAADVRAARLGWLYVDFECREIRKSPQERCELTETESAILGFLLAHRWRAVSRAELLASFWGIHDDVTTRTIDMHIARLRTKLRGSWNRRLPTAIITVRSHGYMAGPEWRVN